MKTIPLIGYSDRLSTRPGDTIAFKVSSLLTQPFSATLHRSISADPNPGGAGIIEQEASNYFSPLSVASREQPFFPGSYGISATPLSVTPQQQLSLSTIVFPTLIGSDEQIILGCGSVEIGINKFGLFFLRIGNTCITMNQTLKIKHWYRLVATINTGKSLTLTQQLLGHRANTPLVSFSLDNAVQCSLADLVSVAARIKEGGASRHFNGKIEAPQIIADNQTLAHWNFSDNIHSTLVKAQIGPDILLKNFPTRAMTSSDWDGSEMCWLHKPQHYAAIHFHEDDIYDFEWDTDFTFTVPQNMRSGVYVMRIECDGHYDAMPFYVCTPLNQPTAKLCLLISTYTYTIYGNHARVDYSHKWQERMTAWKGYPHNPADYKHYGLSTYNNHSDGSGICHASHKRPLFNLRPGYLTFSDTPCSGLRHFQADSHLISWLHAMGIDYDIVTDEELQRDGVDAIKNYTALTTATHPEYHTAQMLDALCDYRNNGGALHYLGGNGFYWRIARHCENDGLLEIRRAEDGIRAWAAEPGEYYNAFDGTYGGLWRRNGRSPQELVGVDFTAQGSFYGFPYQRTCYDSEFDWVFEGIDDDILGDFGYSGNGAAGFELDRYDERQNIFEQVTVLARSITSKDNFMLVPEEQLTHLINLSGESEEEALRADIIYFKVPGGGSVFSTGSITFCGSLPWNNYDNNISRLLRNVLLRSLAPKKS